MISYTDKNAAWLWLKTLLLYGESICHFQYSKINSNYNKKMYCLA